MAAEPTPEPLTGRGTPEQKRRAGKSRGQLVNSSQKTGPLRLVLPQAGWWEAAFPSAPPGQLLFRHRASH